MPAPALEAKSASKPLASSPGAGQRTGTLGVAGGVGFGSGAASRSSHRRAKARQSYAPRAALIAPGTDWNTENYQHLSETSFRSARREPLSTFSVDVDTASYSNVRRFLSDGTLPPPDSVRVEELVNYFSYTDPAPPNGQPLGITSEVSTSPWDPSHKLVRIAVKAPVITQESVPRRNLVFLLDVSGSMQTPDKLPLLKRGMTLLAENLRREDKVSIVVYAGAAGLVLPPTAGDRRSAIVQAIESLEAGGSTNGGEGIELAYRVAREQFVPKGINRVILATDGDFNVGVTGDGDLVRLIEDKRRTGIFLTVLGFGSGNLKDSKMEGLADKGNGNYAYIDSVAEAKKVLVRQAGATLVTVAKDVKLQVEWNPKRVKEYRLVGYENRRLANEDFNDDTKDAGEVGAGHTVTALYEIVPVEQTGAARSPAQRVDPLKYQEPAPLSTASALPELLTLKVRYKAPGSDESKLLSTVVRDASTELTRASADFRFSAAVANFGLLLGKSKFAGASTFASVRKLASGALGPDLHHERAEFLELVGAAERLSKGNAVIAKSK